MVSDTTEGNEVTICESRDVDGFFRPHMAESVAPQYSPRFGVTEDVCPEHSVGEQVAES